VCNASPLIVLSQIDRLDLLAVLSTPVLVPATVLAEIDAGDTRDAAGARLRASHQFRVMADVAVPECVARWQLDAGETQVLSLAWANPGAGVVLDDRAGRRCACSIDLPLVGTLGLVALAKKRGVIEAAAPILRAIIDAGLYVAPGVVRGVLSELGE
jgi:predicted nucleic acid-binding protein